MADDALSPCNMDGKSGESANSPAPGGLIVHAAMSCSKVGGLEQKTCWGLYSSSSEGILNAFGL
ncbi:hypothetical protein T265_00977 [Opisthorchis viverrini]|uniref:Uncharacterized protein n=1 Tax=Opisthorchis viverrini TaxID=6198 RepID=A0A075AJB2_OPIVI|nr:hypothetical protein T265_00977 [Opisthorchis viverrini]KER33079.1 hypothetical protein T265_00977 [Opisthorchis viverrini]